MMGWTERRWRRGRWSVGLLAAVAAHLAGPLLSGPLPAGASTCARAASAAERAWGLPPGLLLAIGVVESSLDPSAINVDGTGQRPGTAAAAIAAVRAEQARGARSIDVGCFQINLKWHPAAFRTLEEAFDPVANGLYAARFLADLYGGAGSWTEAVGLYHSGSDPALQTAYRARVIAAVRQLRAGTDPGALVSEYDTDHEPPHPLRLARAAGAAGWAARRGASALLLAASPTVAPPTASPTKDPP